MVGARFTQDARVKGVMLTGSNATAATIAKDLAERPGGIIPLVAETGGMNAMIVDSTALTEQVVQDVVDSAFKSAGQRCSALRVLYLQEEVADKTIAMLQGAMKQLSIGDPALLQTDVGPVIDAQAHARLSAHVDYLQSINATLHYSCIAHGQHDQGTFFMPRCYEISHISQLKEEVFGPILHIIRYKQSDLDAV